MLWLRFAMIQSDPPIRRTTIRTPKASASTLLALSAVVAICRKNTKSPHLRDRQHDKGDRDARLPYKIGCWDNERGRRRQAGGSQPGQMRRLLRAGHPRQWI